MSVVSVVLTFLVNVYVIEEFTSGGLKVEVLEYEKLLGLSNASMAQQNEPLVQPEELDMPDDEVLYELADLFRVFGDSTRIKILYALHDNELCVQDIANAVQLSQSAVSHQLRVLKDSKLVRFRREGKTVFYSLDDDHVRSVLALGMEHVLEK